MKNFWLGIIFGVLILLFGPGIDSVGATSPILMTHIRPSGPGGALHESIILYNSLDEDVDITDWCIRNKAGISFFCFTGAAANERIHLEPQGHAVIVSAQLRTTIPLDELLWVYTPTHATNGSLTASSGDVALLNAAGEVIDQYAWTVPLLTGQSFIRVITDQGFDGWIVSTDHSLPLDMTRREAIEIPPEEEGEPGEITPPLPSLMPIRLNEVLPNPTGNDTGAEFIELYNPNDSDVDISGFVLEIGIGTTKRITIKTGTIIAAQSYVALTNAEYSYSLNNTSGGVKLYEPGGTSSIDSIVYQDPKEGTSLAYFNGEWRYTFNITPLRENGIVTEIEAPVDTAAQLEPKPCAEGQYRHEETNRCRKIVESSSPVVCKAGQERSPETNRCRNIIAASIPAPCKEGQERNPETNRCRNIVSMSNAAHKVLGVTEQKSNGVSWYIWAAAIVAGAGIVGYAAWEWRVEVKRAFGWVKSRLVSR